ncbi:MAG: DUF2142 domain-containing protein [Chloroflexi bacterium]|nr:DUF2142 domain-containing protein [Chloroflexota bacterium]
MRKFIKLNLALIVVVAAHLSLGIAYGIANPIFESPDELYHYAFVRELVTGRALPIQSAEVGRSESHQPPLYYLLGAAATFWINTDDFLDLQKRNPFWGEDIMLVGRDNKNQFMHTERENPPYHGTVLAIHLIRLLSTIFGALTVVLTYLMASRVFPSKRSISIGAAVLVAFNPQFIFVNSSVSNDSLVATLTAAFLYTLMRWPPVRLHVRNSVILGLLLSAAILTKLSALVLLPLMVIAGLFTVLRRGSVSRTLEDGVVALVTALVVSSWWFARNILLYGEWSGMDTMQRIWRTYKDGPLEAARFADALPSIWRTYWGTFGWGNVPLDVYWYQALLALVCAAGVGLFLGAIRLFSRVTKRSATEPVLGRSPLDQQVYHLMLFVSLLVLVFSTLVYYVETAAFSEFGRFLFPAIPSIALLTFLGLSQLVPRRQSGVIAGTCGMGLFVLSLIALVAYLVPAYSRPVGLPEAEARSVPNPTSMNFANQAEIVGYEIRSKSVDPGQTLEIELFWRALTKMNSDYVVYLHLFTVGDNRFVAQRDTHPGGGTFPTSAWVKGEVFGDFYRIKIPGTIDGPAITRIDVGLYSPGSMERLPLVAGQKGFGQYSASLGTIRVSSNRSVASANAQSVFEGGIELAGHEPDGNIQASRGDVLPIKLVWKAERRVEHDYTVFIHLVDGEGKVVAQRDEKPRKGNYPTWAWNAGEVVEDTHSLRIGTDVQPGVYRVLAGLYDSVSIRRLGVLSSQKRAVDSAITLGDISVR